MGKLIFKILAICFLFFGGVFLVYQYNPINQKLNEANDYLLAIRTKHENLSRLKSPRILFMGGSSAAFGIDSKSIGDSLNMNGFNLGLHAGLGIKFMVNEALDVVRPGDVLIVSTEYYLDEGQIKMLAYMNQKYELTAKYLELGLQEKISYPYELKMIELLERTQRIQATVVKGKKAVVKLDTNDFYKSAGFTGRGDYELHLDKERPWGIFVKYDQKDKDYSAGIEILNRLNALKEKRVRVFYVFPAYPMEEFAVHKVPLKSFESQLKNGLLFPVLGSPEDFLYPENEFYDTVYHLLRKGREKRTATLVRQIREALKNHPKA
jgi:hypothetical protein